MRNGEDDDLEAVDDCNCVNCRLGRLEKSIATLSENIAELVEFSRSGAPPRSKGKA